MGGEAAPQGYAQALVRPQRASHGAVLQHVAVDQLQHAGVCRRDRVERRLDQGLEDGVEVAVGRRDGGLDARQGIALADHGLLLGDQACLTCQGPAQFELADDLAGQRFQRSQLRCGQSSEAVERCFRTGVEDAEAVQCGKTPVVGDS